MKKRSAALGFLLGLALPLTSVAQAPVEADRHSCSELEKLIADAGRLQLHARNRNPGGNEDPGDPATGASRATRPRESGGEGDGSDRRARGVGLFSSGPGDLPQR